VNAAIGNHADGALNARDVPRVRSLSNQRQLLSR
jgi:hypothetical protein